MKATSTNRIVLWICMALIALIFFYKDEIGQQISQGQVKTPITVNAPSDMQKAFQKALNEAGLSEEYKIEITEDVNANITVIQGGMNEENYLNLAYSPFVIAIYNIDRYEKLKKAEVLTQMETNSNYYNVDFERILNEVTYGEGLWENLGVKKENNIKLYYPAKSTVYWHDFYQLMLVNTNNGRFPEKQEEREKCETFIEDFLHSNYTEAVEDFDEKIERNGGFSSNCIFVLPEKTVDNLVREHNETCVVLYPKNTVYFNYYIQYDEVGEKLSNVFEDNNAVFYKNLSNVGYRNNKYSNVSSNLSSNISYRQDVYNVIKVPTYSEQVSNSKQKEEKIS